MGHRRARGLLTEAAHSAIRSPGPLAGFHARVKARRGGGVAIVAVARKLAVIAWHLLTSTVRSTDWPGTTGPGRGRHNGERLVQTRTEVRPGCAVGKIPITPPFAKRSTASIPKIHPSASAPGLDTFIRIVRGGVSFHGVS